MLGNATTQTVRLGGRCGERIGLAAVRAPVVAGVKHSGASNSWQTVVAAGRYVLDSGSYPRRLRWGTVAGSAGEARVAYCGTGQASVPGSRVRP